MSGTTQNINGDINESLKKIAVTLESVEIKVKELSGKVEALALELEKKNKK